MTDTEMTGVTEDESGNYVCHLCQCTLNCPKNLVEHMGGKKHQRNRLLVQQFGKLPEWENRRLVSKANEYTVWYWRDDDGVTWNIYDRDHAELLTRAEAAHEDEVYLDIHQTLYRIDLPRHLQINVNTLFTREIRQGRRPIQRQSPLPQNIYSSNNNTITNNQDPLPDIPIDPDIDCVNKCQGGTATDKLTSRSPQCPYCGVYCPTSEFRDHEEACEIEQVRKAYIARGLEVDEVLLQAALFPREDVDYSQAEKDQERILQTEYDDVVVELALHNYESFHGLQPGSATYATVNATSAGIRGWATCAIEDVKTSEDQDEEFSFVSTAEATQPAIHKGDKEEEEMMRMAVMESMLESRGVQPVPFRRPVKKTVSQASEDYSYKYEVSEDFSYHDEDGNEYEDKEKETTGRTSSDGSWSQVSVGVFDEEP